MSTCAWCKHTYDSTGQPVKKLTEEEFTKTRFDGSSHGICKVCKDKQLISDVASIINIKRKKVKDENVLLAQMD